MLAVTGVVASGQADGRFDLGEGDVAPVHVHTREDEVFMMIKGHRADVVRR